MLDYYSENSSALNVSLNLTHDSWHAMFQGIEEIEDQPLESFGINHMTKLNEVRSDSFYNHVI